MKELSKSSKFRKVAYISTQIVKIHCSLCSVTFSPKANEKDFKSDKQSVKTQQIVRCDKSQINYDRNHRQDCQKFKCFICKAYCHFFCKLKLENTTSHRDKTRKRNSQNHYHCDICQTFWKITNCEKVIKNLGHRRKSIIKPAENNKVGNKNKQKPQTIFLPILNINNIIIILN